MPLFRFSALNANGTSYAGVIDADSFEMAKDRLRQEKILVVDLKEEVRGQKGKRSLKSKEKLLFTRDLLQLLRSGLPLYESLKAIEEKMESTAIHSIFLDITDQVRLGKHLSEALLLHPKSFDSIYISMIQAGEESGNLVEVLKEMVVMIGKQEKLKKDIRSALSYPLFLLIFCFIVLLLLLLYFVPAMKDLFEGRKLPPLTEFILGTSRFVQHHWIMLLVTIGSFIGAFLYWKRTDKGERTIAAFVLNIPILGRLVTETILARFTRSLSALLRSNIPLVKSLELSKKIVDHPLFSDVIERSRIALTEGKKLSYEMKKSKLIPPLLTRMLFTAEENGELPQMLLNVAEIYEEEVERSLKQFIGFLQPVMLLILGAMVAVVMLGTLLPLTDVTSLLDER